jgi:cytochrome c peroxidase
MKIPVALFVCILAFAPSLVDPAFGQNETAGAALFESRDCRTCHTVNEQGGTKARNLSWIGLLRTPESLRRSVTDTSKNPSASALSARRSISSSPTCGLCARWALEPEASERTHDIAPIQNAAFFNRPSGTGGTGPNG